MRIDVHDFAGHPFQVQLSRELARRGHDVVHRWSPDVTTGTGALARREGDPALLAFAPVTIGRAFERYAPVQRLRDELTYGAVLTEELSQRRPDLVLSANTPITVQSRAVRWANRNDVPFVFWLQDVLSIGSAAELERRLGALGALGGRGLRRLERTSLRRADHVVSITDGFEPLLEDWGIRAGARTVIENWTPLDEVPQRPRDNAWAAAHGYGVRPTFLYAGTLGLKHDPAALLALARAVDGRADVVVVTEGIGRDWLAEHGADLLGRTLHLEPFQDWGDLPDVLATADVLVALLEPEAGVFSVPSKVLTGHAAGRAQLTAIPSENLAATILRREGSGVVVTPGDHAAFAAAGSALLDDPAGRATMGSAARAYAERTFRIEDITDRFEQVIHEAVRSRSTQ